MTLCVCGCTATMESNYMYYMYYSSTTSRYLYTYMTRVFQSLCDLGSVVHMKTTEMLLGTMRKRVGERYSNLISFLNPAQPADNGVKFLVFES